MKIVYLIYNAAGWAPESFVNFDLRDLTKQIKQKIRRGSNQHSDIFNIRSIWGD